MSFFNEAGFFLIQTLFDLYIFIILFRVVLQWSGAGPHNPLSLFSVKVTEPILKPLRQFIPIYKAIDIAAVVVILLLHALKFLLIVMLQTGAFPNIFGLLFLSLGNALSQVIDLFFYAIIARVILSWLSNMSGSPIVELVNRVTEPLLSFARRWVPLIGGMDLSPLAVLIVLKLVSIILAHPLLSLGSRMIATSLTSVI